MKEKINKIKELNANKKYRALFLLGLYFIFFVFVYFLFHLGGTMPNIEDEENTDVNTDISVLNKFEQMNNYKYHYEYEVTIEDESRLYTIDGSRYINRELFKISDDNNTYYIEDEGLYTIDNNIKKELKENLFWADLTLLRPKDIAEFINSSTLESTTTIYTNNTIKNNYLLSVKDFIKLYFDEDVNDELDNVIISTYENKDNIISVELDLTKAYKYAEFEISKCILKLDYSNINLVEENEITY